MLFGVHLKDKPLGAVQLIFPEVPDFREGQVKDNLIGTVCQANWFSKELL